MQHGTNLRYIVVGFGGTKRWVVVTLCSMCDWLCNLTVCVIGDKYIMLSITTRRFIIWRTYRKLLHELNRLPSSIEVARDCGEKQSYVHYVLRKMKTCPMRDANDVRRDGTIDRHAIEEVHNMPVDTFMRHGYTE